jgi:hypothetical protein
LLRPNTASQQGHVRDQAAGPHHHFVVLDRDQLLTGLNAGCKSHGSDDGFLPAADKTAAEHQYDDAVGQSQPWQNPRRLRSRSLAKACFSVRDFPKNNFETLLREREREREKERERTSLALKCNSSGQGPWVTRKGDSTVGAQRNRNSENIN